MLTRDYLLGALLGLILLGCFVILGQGLGTQGAVTAMVGMTAQAVAPTAAGTFPAFQHYADAVWWQVGVVVQVVGVLVGAALVAALRTAPWQVGWDRGPHQGKGARWWQAVVGGVLLAVGARLAGGCTSSQVLSGGALLSAGSWLFLAVVFLVAYAVAPAVRRSWR